MARDPMENVQFRGNWSTGSKVWNGARHMNAHALTHACNCARAHTHTHTQSDRKRESMVTL
jgi:hypothetical protein